MPRPIPTHVLHFTHIDHLQGMVREGLMPDSLAHRTGVLLHEAGDRGVKQRRRSRPVPVGRGGVVADYVPFYFAPRSPMMFVISKGRVPEFDGSIRDLVYLVSTIERLRDVGAEVVLSDRNAAKQVAEFSSDERDWDELVDWDLMREQVWRHTEEDPERPERRMAECLVHGGVGWEAVQALGVADEVMARQARDIMERSGVGTPVHVRPGWYF